MSKRDEFKALMQINKRAMPNITNEARNVYLKAAKDDYGLTPEEAEKILKEVGITVGPSVNYFEVLGLSIDELKNLSETEAEKRIKDAYEPLFRSLRNSNNPRKRKQLDEVSEAKKVLIDEGKLQQYIAENISETSLETYIPDGLTHNLCLASFKYVKGQLKQYSHVIIPKMTPIPCEVDNTLATVGDNQSQILISLYQGLEQDQLFEEIVDPEEFKLGDCQIELPPNLPKGATIKVTYKYDLDQTLEVTAEVPDGRTANVTINMRVII